MSQAGIVILAEYFGIEETIKEMTEGTTGGVTLAEFEQLKKQIKDLLEKVNLNRLIIDKLPDQDESKVIDQNKTTSKPLIQVEEQDSKPKLKLSSEPPLIEPITGHLLSKRFGMSKNAPSESKRKYDLNKFAEWSQSKDPDNITWTPTENGYVPKDELPDELLSKLQN